MPLDPLGSLSDPTCHGFTLADEACAKLMRREVGFGPLSRAEMLVPKCKSPLRAWSGPYWPKNESG